MNEKDQVIYTNMLMPKAEILNSVKANGLINSKRIEKIATLDSSLVFDSSQTFTSLEAASVQSDNKISLIDFRHWYENVLWKNGKDDNQVVNGNWKISKAFLDDDVFGNGFINQRPINEIERNLATNINGVELALGNYAEQYSDMCEKMQHRAENYAQNSIYILKYFESSFKIIESSEIFSYFSFKTKDRNYLLVNTKCETHIYKWSHEHENFMKVNSVDTGVVYNWIKLEPQSNKGSDEGVFIITNSRMKAGGECTYGGLNSWKLIDDQLINMVKISSEDDILELHADSTNTNSFYALNITDHVISFDFYGRILEEWTLPAESLSYNFLPSGILSGLNLHNGRRVYSLDSKFLRRHKRNFYPEQQSSRSKRSPTFSFNMPTLPSKERKHFVPTIPQKPIEATSKRLDFMSKLREAGEIIMTSFNIETERIKNLKPTIDETKNDIKLAKLKNETNKLLFVINSPNISSFKKNLNVSMKQDRILTGKLFTTLNEIENSDKSETHKTTEAPIQSSTTLPEDDITTTTQNSLLTNIRIIMPPDEIGNEATTSEQGSPAIEDLNKESFYSLGVDKQIEIAAVQGSGVRNMENNYIPEKELGEVTVLYVGVNNKQYSTTVRC